MLFRCFAALIVFRILAVEPSASLGQSRSKVLIGYASMSSVATTLWVAQEKGFLAKHGIDAQTIIETSGVLEQVLGGKTADR